MKRLSMVCIAGILLACHDSTPVPTAVKPPPQQPPPQPPPPVQELTHVVFGIVRDTSGAPVFGAVAMITTGKYAGRVAISNSSGYFAFSGVLGELTIRIVRDGYERAVKTVDVTGDMVLDVRLVVVNPSDTIQLGRSIRSSVESFAPPCDPVRWDAEAPCKTFHLKAPMTGTLVITVSWEGGSDLDATVVTLDDVYVATSTESGKQNAVLVARVTEGVIYEIRVNAYYTGNTFTLGADLSAPARR
jgi:hypothetical protein